MGVAQMITNWKTIIFIASEPRKQKNILLSITHTIHGTIVYLPIHEWLIF